MRLQDLKNDLADHFCNGKNNTCSLCHLAGQILALVEDCECRTHRMAALATAMLPMKHNRCGGSGIVYSPAGRPLALGQSFIRYLFGEEGQ
jgi:hypothetical protein